MWTDHIELHQGELDKIMAEGSIAETSSQLPSKTMVVASEGRTEDDAAKCIEANVERSDTMSFSS